MPDLTVPIPSDPMGPAHPKFVTCTATNRAGNRCGRPPIPGGSVCRLHGGGAPQVRAAAEERILKLVAPALAELKKLITKADSDAVRIRAIKDVLDRAGLAAPAKFEHTGADGDPLFSIDAVRQYMQNVPDDEE